MVGLLAAAGALVARGPRPSSAARTTPSPRRWPQGATGDTFVTTLTAWYWVTGVGARCSRLVASAWPPFAGPGWPAMGSRYDAPAARAERPAPPTQDLWRALDEGRDPTA